ncbi:hypothetical protein BC629DRAFT_1587619 [Irpex lacteus]|nr:hypothetical protein BC629DRAFT_1587619 [Irpex lacteus]
MDFGTNVDKTKDTQIEQTSKPNATPQQVPAESNNVGSRVLVVDAENSYCEVKSAHGGLAKKYDPPPAGHAADVYGGDGPSGAYHPFPLHLGGHSGMMEPAGWPKMAKIIREVDEQKIEDCKEDIDSILIFAGLFSAAMTAFLVQSYQNLSQDPTQIMILLMQQLVTQTNSYSINGASLNSTIPPPMKTAPPFQPTVNAIRVNVLWFASLTLTLMSASFSILVKQWLREFLAGEYTSPQARLRVRHFRTPGLQDWKVFEIAGFLPLLLQLALALFLIGLYFFTADIHTTLGHTTLPLVVAWGILILAVSFAPALSPRCPYKTALLKSTMKKIRACFLRLLGLWESIATAVPRGSADEGLVNASKRWNELLRQDEEEIAKVNSNDIDILIAVDAIQSDDNLFDIMLGIIFSSVQQSQTSAAGERTESLLRILRRRSKQDQQLKPTFLDLTRLPRETITSIMSIVKSMLKEEINRQSSSTTANIEWFPWMVDCAYILLSHTDSSSTAEAAELCLQVLANEVQAEKLLRPIFSYNENDNPPSSLRHVLDRLRVPFKLDEAGTAFVDLTAIPGPTVQSIMSVVTKVLKEEIDRQSSSSANNVELDWLPWMGDCAYVLLSRTGIPPTAEAAQLCLQILTDGGQAEKLRGPVCSHINLSWLRHVLDRLGLSLPRLDEAETSFLDLTSISETTVQSIMSVVTKVLKEEIDHQSSSTTTNIEWSPWMGDCAYILLSHTNAPSTAEAAELCFQSLVDSVQAEKLLRPLFSHIENRDPLSSLRHVLDRLRVSLKQDAAETAFLDLTAIPEPTVQSIIYVVTKVLEEEIDRQSSSSANNVELDWLPWMGDCVYILLSNTVDPLPPASANLCSQLLANLAQARNLLKPLSPIVQNPDDRLKILRHILNRLTEASCEQRDETRSSFLNLSTIPNPALHSFMAMAAPMLKEELDQLESLRRERRRGQSHCDDEQQA